MIHDPEIRVECDGCGNNVPITPNLIGFDGERDCSETATKSALRKIGWICRDGKQFCCERCANKDL